MGKPYFEKLQDPRWQRKRLEIYERDDFACQICGNGEETLAVHHMWYEKGKEPWDYPPDSLFTVCSKCHQKLRHGPSKEQWAVLFGVESCEFSAQATRTLACGFVRLGLAVGDAARHGIKMDEVAETLSWLLYAEADAVGRLGDLIMVRREGLKKKKRKAKK